MTRLGFFSKRLRVTHVERHFETTKSKDEKKLLLEVLLESPLAILLGAFPICSPPDRWVATNNRLVVCQCRIYGL
jgi:hypothetical protein